MLMQQRRQSSNAALAGALALLPLGWAWHCAAAQTLDWLQGSV